MFKRHGPGNCCCTEEGCAADPCTIWSSVNDIWPTVVRYDGVTHDGENNFQIDVDGTNRGGYIDIENGIQGFRATFTVRSSNNKGLIKISHGPPDGSTSKPSMAGVILSLEKNAIWHTHANPWNVVRNPTGDFIFAKESEEISIGAAPYNVTLDYWPHGPLDGIAVFVNDVYYTSIIFPGYGLRIFAIPTASEWPGLHCFAHGFELSPSTSFGPVGNYENADYHRLHPSADNNVLIGDGTVYIDNLCVKEASAECIYLSTDNNWPEPTQIEISGAAEPNVDGTYTSNQQINKLLKQSPLITAPQFGGYFEILFKTLRFEYYGYKFYFAPGSNRTTTALHTIASLRCSGVYVHFEFTFHYLDFQFFVRQHIYDAFVVQIPLPLFFDLPYDIEPTQIVTESVVEDPRSGQPDRIPGGCQGLQYLSIYDIWEQLIGNNASFKLL